ncbi:DUF368 domain-containing protein [Cryobacterium psychrophilum]|uniref:DUF368 domain-containing protein n=1 Tax=Cryobacterium psychrophilum TaxID=41988 RepID=A0A4Y8KKE2_9MICO|nr:DUF368 domain-containing protein [Cryobacterium psychrophilum]TDW28843.1 putative membrane protein [Cryobacterium psychrophilum]TFD76188.1 DUF368 domain-containing protein [Cryobacterium psychrophilum]
MSATTPVTTGRRGGRAPAALRAVVDVARGALIGAAEIVPGVSGGTIALIVGVYGHLIDGAGHLARGVALLVADAVRARGAARAMAHFRSVRWTVMIPIGLGMVGAILIGARLLAPLLDDFPVGTRAVFAGLIVASLIVPIRMVGSRWRPRDIALALLAAAVTFALIGLPPAGEIDPPLILVAVSAGFAVCALVLPGVSGSFLLLTLGMYAPTLEAVNDRDLTYLGAFVVGAVLGLGVFVSGLQWLFAHHHRVTLVVMTGLLLGSLRALWPWQGAQNGLLAPSGDVGLAIALFIAGAALVTALVVVEGVLVRRRVLAEHAVVDEVPDADRSAEGRSRR